ncbi:MAG TPA: tetratricopeptide repeat protein [Bacteroidia bacterium]|jgi:tetratricopeptide (TPR) repeat protein
MKRFSQKGVSFFAAGYFLSLLLFSFSSLNAREQQTDSLIRLLSSSKNDSLRINIYVELGWEYMEKGEYTMANDYATEGLTIAYRAFHGSHDTLFLLKSADLYNLLGAISLSQDKYEEAITLFDSSLQMSRQARFKKGKGRALGNLGLIYKSQGNYPRALEYMLQALQIAEEQKNKKSIATNYGNIGVIYDLQQDYTHALDYYFKALSITREMHNDAGSAIHLGNIGVTLKKQEHFTEALGYYKQALDICRHTGYRQGISLHSGNIGSIYYELGFRERNPGKQRKLYDTALTYHYRALSIDDSIENLAGQARHLGNISSIYLQLKNYSRAKDYLQKALNIANTLHLRDMQAELEKGYCDLDSALGQYTGALEHFERFVSLHDSISNAENTKKQTQLEMQYGFNKKQQADSISHAEQLVQERMKNEEEEKQQREFTIGGVVGFILMLVIALISLNAYRQKQKANETISRQKRIVEEKQREMLDSIYYARKIQSSLLPSEKYLARALKKSKNELE